MKMLGANHLRWQRPLLPLSLLLLLCLGAGLCKDIEAKKEDTKGDGVENTLQKEPEISPVNKLMSCYEEDHRFTPIISRDDWVQRKNLMHSPHTKDYIVVLDGGKHCKSHAECLTSLASEMRKTTNEECRILENFYIGGNGEVYEGRGWISAPYWHLNGMRKTAVTVKFLGTHESEGPGESVLRAFWRMAKSGVWRSRLSPDYRVVSMGQVYNDSTLVGHALEKVFKDSSVGVKELNMMTTWELTPDKTLPLITREEWGAKKPTKQSSEMGFRIKYVMINEGGERCFTHEGCLSRIKAEQEQQLHIYGDLVDNFYVGDDGYVYEGRGFNVKPLWDTELEVEDNNSFKEDSMTVRFFGSFQSDLPSERALGALKLLVNTGVWLYKMKDDYKMYSLRGVYDDSRFLGDRLFETAKNWTPWATELEERIAKKVEDGDGFMGMVKRETWGAKDATKELEKLNHPVDFVVVDEHSEYERCLNSKKCAEIMKDIQESELEGYGDLKYNFYISDNGNVYEGRGWDTEPQFQAKYFNKSLITVNFIGNHQADGASLMALAAFDNLIRVGVKLGKIAPNYHIYTSRDVYGDASLLGDGLKSYFVKKEKWLNNLDLLTEKERFDSGLLPIISHDNWSERAVNAEHHAFTDPVHYVIVSNMRERCYTIEKCSAIMKEAHKTEKAKREGPLDNFYIGDDGLAYEGRGWMFAPSLYREGVKSEFYRVTFLGQYKDESHPSKLSILAFNRLMENGVKMHKLAPNYKIISIQQIFEGDTGSTDNLYSTIKTWDSWIQELNFLPEIEGTSSVNKIFVSREDWHADEPVRSRSITKRPVGYVVVRRAGDDCGDLTSCMESMRKIQKNLLPRHWDVADNFYVGGDGHIYEGRGGNHSSLWATSGIEENFISVGFFGSFESTPPTPKALSAFNVLMQYGVTMGMLAPDVAVISLGKIVGKDQVTEKLIEALKTADGWSDTFELKWDAARLRSLDTSFVLSDEWNHSNLSIRKSADMSHPLKYITIRDGGASCDTYETCFALINKEHKDRHDSDDGGVTENFYIGNDGTVFEGTGWDWDMMWAFHGWRQSAQVQFFGNYENDLPSQKAIDAFNNVIIKVGNGARKLSSNYHIVPTPSGRGRTLGSKLRAEIMTWKNAIEEIP